MRLDYLYGTPFEIYQDEEMFHFNSDTELLGRFIKVSKNDSVLDIGCNNGALLLYAGMHGNKRLTGVDIFEKATSLARENLERNGLEGTFHTCRIQDYEGMRYDIIMCNPPYFDTRNEDLKNLNPYLRAARHEEYLSLWDLLSSVKRLLAKNGTFFMVHRPDRMQEVILQCAKLDMHVCVVKLAYASHLGRAKSILYGIRHGEGGMKVDSPAYLDDRDSFQEVRL